MDTIDYNIIISILTLLSNIIIHFKFRHCHSLCFSSDCVNTPTSTQSHSISSTNSTLKSDNSVILNK